VQSCEYSRHWKAVACRKELRIQLPAGKNGARRMLCHLYDSPNIYPYMKRVFLAEPVVHCRKKNPSRSFKFWNLNEFLLKINSAWNSPRTVNQLPIKHLSQERKPRTTWNSCACVSLVFYMPKCLFRPLCRFFLCAVALRPNAGHGLLILEVF